MGTRKEVIGMKKASALLAVAAFAAFGLVACGSSSNNNNDTTAAATPTQTAPASGGGGGAGSGTSTVDI